MRVESMRISPFAKRKRSFDAEYRMLSSTVFSTSSARRAVHQRGDRSHEAVDVEVVMNSERADEEIVRREQPAEVGRGELTATMRAVSADRVDVDTSVEAEARPRALQRRRDSRSGDMPFDVIGPLTIRAADSEYERANIVSDSGCASSATS